MAYRVPESGDSLSGQNSPGGVSYRTRDHDRQTRTGLLKIQIDREQCCFAVQRIKDGFDQQYIRPTLDQCSHLFVVRGNQLIKADIARARIVNIGRNGGRLRRRAERASDKARLVGGGILIASGPRNARCFEIHLAHQMRHVVIVLRDRGGTKGIGFDQVSARSKILLVNLLNNVRLR